ncbi:TOBE domain-containing protein, partial [Sebaldella sp. S0638]|uniref:TOBE domain-containing protein n=1 Tax=Sebaldella sp. S0638 TaxID=2957809 RepID=UPI00209D3FF6
THDQVEAMTMGDRICVLREGKIMQVETPLNLYNHPANKFVAGFIGSPTMNFLNGVIEERNGKMALAIKDTVLEFPEIMKEKVKAYIGKEVAFGIRPEHITLGHDGDSNALKGNILVKEQMGNEEIVYFDCGGNQITARLTLNQEDSLRLKDSGIFKLDMEKCHLFSSDSEEAL